MYYTIAEGSIIYVTVTESKIDSENQMTEKQYDLMKKKSTPTTYLLRSDLMLTYVDKKLASKIIEYLNNGADLQMKFNETTTLQDVIAKFYATANKL